MTIKSSKAHVAVHIAKSIFLVTVLTKLGSYSLIRDYTHNYQSHFMPSPT